MSKQCLDVQQMQHLQELGLKLKPSLVHYYFLIIQIKNFIIYIKYDKIIQY